MRRVGAPHVPAGVARVAGFEADQAAAVCADVDPTAVYCRLEDDRLAERDAPEILAALGREAMDRPLDRPEEELPVDDGRRRQRAIEQLLSFAPRRPDRLLPVNVVRAWLGRAHGVAPGRVEPASRDKRL